MNYSVERGRSRNKIRDFFIAPIILLILGITFFVSAIAFILLAPISPFLVLAGILMVKINR